MKKALRDRIHKMIEEEEQHDVDQNLLDMLRALAAEDSKIIDLPAPTRISLNTFFREIKSLMFNELVTGDYGAEIVVEAAVVLAFEVGYRLKETEQST